MKLTIQDSSDDEFKRTIFAEISDDSDIHQTFDMMCRLLIAYGFCQKNIEEAIANSDFNTEDE